MLINRKKQRGFTLLEILIAVVILSIGLLGLAGLQALSLKFNNSAAQRSQAIILAYDMLDRMRANRALAESGSYDTSFAAGPAASVSCSSACANAALATYDTNQWLCSLGKWESSAACGNPGSLLEGDGKIARNGNVVTVTIRWADDLTKPDGDAGRTTEISVSTIL